MTIHDNSRPEPQKLPPVQPQKPAANDPYGCDTPEGLIFTASLATECTGLIPAAPQSEAELEAYEDLYPYNADALRG